MSMPVAMRSALFCLLVFLVLPWSALGEDPLGLKNSGVPDEAVMSPGQDQVMSQPGEAEEEELGEEELTAKKGYKDVFWGVGACLGISHSGIMNAIKIKRFQWNVSLVPPMNYGGSYHYWVGTELQYDFYQKHNRRFLAYIAYSRGNWRQDYGVTYFAGTGIGYGYLLSFAEISAGAGLAMYPEYHPEGNTSASEYYVYPDFHVAMTYFF
jgi:hypothetical protein